MRLTGLLFAKRLINSAIQASEREIEIKAPWGKIAALTWGDSSNPPVFLCHGRLDSCTSFRRLVHHLPEGNYYVSVDLPGNGRSDQLPRGARHTLMDFIPTLARVREHFEWDKFVFVGHSLGAALSKYYNIIYPGQMTRIVELDPEPAYLRPVDGDLRAWYRIRYEPFYREYDKYNAGPETAPRYSYEEAREKLMKARSLDEDAADQILERCLEPTGDGKFRITFDQRMKLTCTLPFSADQLRQLYTASPTPTLAILASESVARGVYAAFPFATDERAWPNGNYTCVVVDASHDVHLVQAGRVAALIVDFLRQADH